MTKTEEKIEFYIEEMGKLGISFEKDLFTKVVKGLGPSIFKKDAELVSSSDDSEIETVKKNFLIKKHGLESGEAIDKAVAAVVEKMGSSNRNKYRAIFYYLLVEDLKLAANYADDAKEDAKAEAPKKEEKAPKARIQKAEKTEEVAVEETPAAKEEEKAEEKPVYVPEPETPHDEFDWTVDKRNVSYYSQEEIDAMEGPYTASLITLNENEIVKNYINNDFNSLNSKSQIEFMLSKLNNTLYNEINIKLWKYLGSSNFEEKINNLHKQFMIILSYYKIAFPNNDYIMKMLVNDLSFAERINLAQIKLQNSTTENIKDNLTVFFNEIKKCYDSNSIIENKLINPLNDLVKNGNNATLIKAVQNLKKYTRVADMLLHRKIKRDFSNNNYMFHSYKSPNNYKPSNYKITSDSSKSKN